MSRSDEEDDLLEIPSPAEQARTRKAVSQQATKKSPYEANLDLLSPFARKLHLEEDKAHVARSREAGLKPSTIFLNRVTIAMGAQGMINAGGEKKNTKYGGSVGIEEGAEGIMRHSREYRAGFHRQRSNGGKGEKNEAGALAGARYGSPEMFPGKFPNIVAGPISVGFGRSAGGVNIDILGAGKRGFASRANT